MRLLMIFTFFSSIYIVFSKNNVKSLTESMGQEVIEIGTPIKELPMGLEEEPSADVEDDDKQKITSNTVQPTSKKASKKTTSILPELRNKLKDVEKIDGLNQEDEEARIEKELAEIYKDTADYKSDSAEEKDVKEEKKKKEEPTNELPSEEGTSVEETEKPIARQKNSFKFQPDTTGKADIERFRTSIDEISCNNRKKLSGTNAPAPEELNNAFNIISNGVTLITSLLCYFIICT